MPKSETRQKNALQWPREVTGLRFSESARKGVKVGNVMENVSFWPRVEPLSENFGRELIEFCDILVNLTHRHVF